MTEENLDVQYDVMVDDNFHFMDEEERCTDNTYASADEAIARCKQIVDQSLRWNYKPGMTQEELYDRYIAFGDDPFVIARNSDERVTFCAWTYAEARAAEIVKMGIATLF